MTLCLIVSRMCKNNSAFCSLAEEKKIVYTQIYGNVFVWVYFKTLATTYEYNNYGCRTKCDQKHLHF